MSNKLQNELNELLANQVITTEIAQKISNFYQQKNNQTPSKILIIFGILGALLGGLGIILLLAHNWDNFSIVTKSFLALLPLAVGQIASGYSLFYQPNSKAWKEASGVFLFFAVGESMALISQIYNIPGEFSQYVLTWMLLCLPLVYILNSSVVSLLYIIGITTYCVTLNSSFTSSTNPNYWCGLLILGVVPHYFQLITQKKDSNFTAFHHWFMPISIAIIIFCFNQNNSDLISIITFIALFNCFYLIGKTHFFKTLNTFSNGYKVLGKMGSLVFLIMLSFRVVWIDIIGDDFEKIGIFLYITIFLLIVISFLLYLQFNAQKNIINNAIKYTSYFFLIALAIGFVDLLFPVILINVYVLFLGIQEIIKGNKINDIKRMNFGILIIVILLVCRFFDTDMSFVIRGILFIIIGFGFFFLNYMMIKNRKKNNLQQQNQQPNETN